MNGLVKPVTSLAAAAVVVLALAPLARAATVRVVDNAVVFQAAPGEANAVSVDLSEASGFAVVVVDRGPATLTAGDGCEHSAGQDSQTVSCSWRSNLVAVDLADADDSFEGSGLRAEEYRNLYTTVDGGDGADRIVITSGIAVGGIGDDTVTVSGTPGHATDAPNLGVMAYVPVDRFKEPWHPCRYSPAPRLPRTGYFSDRVADGGPGNDVVTGEGETDFLLGGPGDDRIQGGGGADTLQGGDGADVIDGGPGRDELTGNEGADRLVGGDHDDFLVSDAGADVIVGGAGYDEACFYSRSSGVTVDVFPEGADMPPGTGEQVSTDVERVGGSPWADVVTGRGAQAVGALGGGGDDRLVGGPGGDTLSGGFDDDTILGGPGNDVLDGGPEAHVVDGESVGSEGRDVIEGGPGRDSLTGDRGVDYLDGGDDTDRIVAVENPRRGPSSIPVLNHSPVVPLAQGDQVWCGAGRDVIRADFNDGIGADCEVGSHGTPDWRDVALSRGGSLALRVRCAWLSSAPCRGTARVVAAVNKRIAASAGATPGVGAPSGCSGLPRREPLLASDRFRLRAGRVGRVEIPLTARGRALVARRDCVAVRVAFDFRDRRGRRFGSSRTLALSAGRYRP